MSHVGNELLSDPRMLRTDCTCPCHNFRVARMPCLVCGYQFVHPAPKKETRRYPYRQTGPFRGMWWGY